MRSFLTLICTTYFTTGLLGRMPINLALNKPSTQSSTNIIGNVTYSASRANDGDEATRAQTKRTTQPSFWWVDLEEQVHVTFILIKLEYPWHNQYVGVDNNPPTAASVPGQDFRYCEHFTIFPGDWIQTIPCNLSGRYVIVFCDYSAQLIIVDVEVYNTPEPGKLGIGRENLARKKTPVLSSTASGYPASRANDGNPDSAARPSENGPLPTYLYVDLEERYQMTSIIIYNLGRWDNLAVGVSDINLSTGSVTENEFKKCPGMIREQYSQIQNIPCGLSGRYVIIFSKSSTDIWIKEVDIYGYRDAAISTRDEPEAGTSLRTKEPPSLRTTEPSSLRTTEPPSLRTKEPSSLRTTEPSSLRTTEPPSLKVKEPSSLRTTEPSLLRTTEPSSLRTKEPSSLRTTEPPSLRTKEPSSLRTTEPPSWSVFKENMDSTKVQFTTTAKMIRKTITQQQTRRKDIMTTKIKQLTTTENNRDITLIGKIKEITTQQLTMTDNRQRQKQYPKADWKFMTWSLLFFAGIPILTFLACWMRRSITDDRNEVAALRERRDVLRRQHAEIDQNKLMEGRNTKTSNDMNVASLIDQPEVEADARNPEATEESRLPLTKKVKPGTARASKNQMAHNETREPKDRNDKSTTLIKGNKLSNKPASSTPKPSLRKPKVHFLVKTSTKGETKSQGGISNIPGDK